MADAHAGSAGGVRDVTGQQLKALIELLALEDGGNLAALVTRLGEVQGNPTANTVLARLKDIVTALVSVAVTGPLTDAQLRASAVSVTGALTDAQLRASAVSVTGPDVVLASSGAAPIVAAADTVLVAAPAGAQHLRVYYIMANNSSATACRVSWMDGAAGTQRFPITLTQYEPFAHAFRGYWDLTSATALYMKTSAAGSIDWTVEYEVVAD